ncbi:MAG: TonB-dependent receptor plug domain-containing protein, partial [Rhodanobacteraceae bacterium]
MRLTSNELFKAVRYALYAGASAVVGLSAAPVFAQDTAQDQNTQQGEKLETITVTGSNIRRVDIETANPVITIDRAQIEQSGKLTIGDLVQELPSIAGAATNPQVNNGGGGGSSTVSLRGLGSGRTLILVDGQRVLNNDINTIPASVVERIEVLKDGASSVYGSDAIGGVVNFIMRKDYQGAEFTGDY